MIYKICKSEKKDKCFWISLSFSNQESEVRKNNNRIGGAAVSDRYPKPKRKQRMGGLTLNSHLKANP